MKYILAIMCMIMLIGCYEVERGEAIGGKVYRTKLVCGDKVLMENKKYIVFDSDARVWKGISKDSATEYLTPELGIPCKAVKYVVE